MTGRVALVGAGPGDPGLLTLRALEVVEAADVIFTDRLVSQEVLDLVPTGTEIVDVGKTGGQRRASTPQAHILALLLEAAQRGLDAVRLKGGDPFVFGRGGEELAFLRRHGVAVEIVPGLSSALAGPASAGIPVTHRGTARGVRIQTEARRSPASTPQLRATAGENDNQEPDTVVSLMPLSRIEELQRKLLNEQRPPTEAAAIIERATLPDQRTIRTTLGQLPRAVVDHEVGSPALVLVGAAAGLELGTKGRLGGLRLLNTRPRRPARRLSALLEAHGADVTWRPLIEIKAEQWSADEAATIVRHLRVASLDWIIFTSLHGVRGFFRLLDAAACDLRSFTRARLASIGPRTASELRRFGAVADLVASPARATALLRELRQELGHSPPTDSTIAPRLLHPCGSLARREVRDSLATAGHSVEALEVYQTNPGKLDPRTCEDLRRGRYDAVLLYSPTAVEALRRSLIEPTTRQPPLPHPEASTLICVGPTTARAAQRAFPRNLVTCPRTYGDAGVLEALLEIVERRHEASFEIESTGNGPVARRRFHPAGPTPAQEIATP